MTFPQLAAFARLADGSVAPVRSIAGQKTLLDRAQHDLYYDEVHDEVTIANPVAQAIIVYAGGAKGEEPPLRVIQGPHTGIQSPDFGVQVDPIHNEIYVAEHDFVLVFPRMGNGDVAPIRVLKGPHTQLANPYGENAIRSIGVDPINNVLVVTGDYVNRGRILIFDREANGDTKPLRVIMGPRTLLGSAGYHMRLYPPKGLILQPARGGIGVWSVNDDGDIPPRYLLSSTSQPGRDGDEGENDNGGRGNGGGQGFSSLSGGFALNPKGKEVIISGSASIITYSFPEIF